MPAAPAGSRVGIALAVLLLLARLAASPAPAVAGGVSPPSPEDAARWLRLDTGAFVVLTDGGAESARKTADDLERLRQAFARITHLKVDAPLPTRVYAFRNTRAFRA